MRQPAIAVDTAFAAMSCEAESHNVSPVTLLATDYLNHFNEVVMLLEMLPMAPECAEDVRSWRPKSYVQHFRDSAFTDRDFAIHAYDAAPAEYRQPFDKTVEALNGQIAAAVAECCALAEAGDMTALERATALHVPLLHATTERASALIHGNIEVDVAAADAQAAIDALFDD
ncbi:MAG: hypothetical protein RIB84_28310 [Sneathiellaceae bacterium]